MDNDKDLASPNFRGAAAGIAGSAAMAAAAQRGPKWLRYLLYVFIAITLTVTVIGMIDKISGIGKLPACDAQTTRDTLSDLNKLNKFSATKYNFIKNVATSDSEVTCTASLALSGGGKVEYDYRIYKEKASVKVQITEIRR